MDIGKWNRLLVISIFSMGSIIAASNVVYDHYGVFNAKLVENDQINLNQRYAKVRYLRQQPQYNAFHLGSSKLGHFPAKHHAALAPRSEANSPLNWYNLGVFSGMPTDYLKLLRWLVEEGRAVDDVLIGLDYYAFFSPPDLHQAGFRHHPDVSGRNWIEDIASYAYRTSFVYLFTNAGYFFADEPPPYRHDISTGRYLPIRALHRLGANYQSYWRNEIARVEAVIANQKGDFVLHELTVDALAELRRWLEGEGISARFYVQPLHRLTRKQFGENAAANVSKALSAAGIDDAWRFDQVECLSVDDATYFDVQHYRPAVAMALLDVIYAEAPIENVCAQRTKHIAAGSQDTLALFEQLTAREGDAKRSESVRQQLALRHAELALPRL